MTLVNGHITFWEKLKWFSVRIREIFSPDLSSKKPSLFLVTLDVEIDEGLRFKQKAKTLKLDFSSPDFCFLKLSKSSRILVDFSSFYGLRSNDKLPITINTCELNHYNDHTYPFTNCHIYVMPLHLRAALGN